MLDSVEVKLRPNPKKILFRFLRQPGVLIKKDDLMNSAWEIGTEELLAQAIRSIRVALGDKTWNPRFIETVPYKGYKFICPVEEDDGQDTQSKPSITSNSSSNVPGVDTFGLGHSLNRRQMPAAQVIDNAFMHTINTGPQFSREQFLSAKQDEDCQWFGIVSDFDVERAEYPRIKSVALAAFDHRSTSKVSLLVSGPGGIGKSTLLRRLAIDMARSQKATVIWVEDLKLDEFVKSSLDLIEADRESNYLVFIEDWYRQASVTDPMIADTLLKRSQSIRNIRLLIGDREISGKPYLQYRSSASNQFELHPSENEQILNEIYRGRPDDSPVRLLLKNDAIFRSSLFIVLYVISGLERGIDIDFEFQDAENAACQIAAHDLKRIFARSPGVAMALHYWAAISTVGQSAAGRPIITWASFLKLADLFSDDGTNSSSFSSWDRKSDVLDVLKLYVNLGPGDGTGDPAGQRVRFNHDTIAERVISRAGLAGWADLDDDLKRKILDFAVGNFDHYSVSTLLRALIRSERSMFDDDADRLAYISKLFESGNREPHYLSCLSGLSTPATEMRRYLDKLWDENVYLDTVWIEYFRRGEPGDVQQAAKMILSAKARLVNMSPVLFNRALEICKEPEIRESAVISILEHPDLHTIPDSTLTAVLGYRISGRPQNVFRAILRAQRKAAKTILRRYRLDGYGPTAYVAACKLPGNDPVKRYSSIQILGDVQMINADPHVVTQAFSQLQKDFAGDAVETSLRAAYEILRHKDLPELPQEIIVSALLQSGPRMINLRAAGTPLTFKNMAEARRDDRFEALKSDAAGRILATLCDGDLGKRGSDLSPNIFDQIFKVPGNEALKEDFATKLLTEVDPGKIPHVVVRHIFKNSSPSAQIDFADRVTKADNWFDDTRLSPPLIVATSRVASADEVLRERVLSHVDIMNAGPEELDQRRSFLYHGLLGIPLEGVAEWESAVARTMANWQSLDRRGVNAILGSGYFEPAELKDICKVILENWETELQQPIARWFAPPNRGGHIQRALGHPDLSALAAATAARIRDRMESDAKRGRRAKGLEFLTYTVNAILCENDFNHWTTDDSGPVDR